MVNMALLMDQAAMLLDAIINGLVHREKDIARCDVRRFQVGRLGPESAGILSGPRARENAPGGRECHRPDVAADSHVWL